MLGCYGFFTKEITKTVLDFSPIEKNPPGITLYAASPADLYGLYQRVLLSCGSYLGQKEALAGNESKEENEVGILVVYLHFCRVATGWLPTSTKGCSSVALFLLSHDFFSPKNDNSSLAIISPRALLCLF